MELTNKRLLLAGCGFGLCCGIALSAIILVGGYLYHRRQAAPARPVPAFVPAPPPGRMPAPVTPPDAVNAWRQYAPPTTPLVTPPSIPGPYGVLPTARGSFVAARIGDRVVAIGGYRRSPTYFLDVNEVLDLATGRWDRGTPHPMRLESASATAYGESLFVCGGSDGVHTRREAYFYDPAADVWTQATSMPYPRYGSPAVVGPDGRIYVIGYQEQGRDPHLVQVYDPVAGRWEVRTAPFNAGGEPAVATLGDRIFLFGGAELGTGRRENKVLIYYPDTDRWEQGAPMPVARMGGAAAVWDGRIYVFGGQDEPADRRSYAAATMARVDVYDPAADRWTPARDMAQPRLRLRAVVVDEGILLLGGLDGNANAYDAAELYVP